MVLPMFSMSNMRSLDCCFCTALLRPIEREERGAVEKNKGEDSESDEEEEKDRKEV